MPALLGEAELDALRGTGEPMLLSEVEEIYLPLTRLINLHVDATRRLARVADDFVGRPAARRPFVIALAGSVAVGKSTVARLLRTLLSRWPDHPHVELVTTDGFLHQRAHLQSTGLMERKGFPESYDVRRMIRFLADVRATGCGSTPVYSHEAYDIVPDQCVTIDRPDILIFEGLNVLQIGSGGRTGVSPVFTSSDFFDFSLYIDAKPTDIEHWYIDRFLLLKKTAFRSPFSYFHHLADVTTEEARDFATNLWRTVNLRNLEENIAPTRARADVVIHKRADHVTDGLWLRRF